MYANAHAQCDVQHTHKQNYIEMFHIIETYFQSHRVRRTEGPCTCLVESALVVDPPPTANLHRSQRVVLCL